MAALLAFFGTTAGQIIIQTLGGTTAFAVGGWLLGRMQNVAAFKSIYTKLRDKSGRQAYRMGLVVSKIGNTKLGPIWNPIEEMATDFGAFWVEQFFVGLREDNPAKLAKQLDRLEAVGSETRAAGIAQKIQDAQDAGIAFRASFGDSSIRQKLEEG